MSLGGVGEFGKNMYIVEVDNDIYILDAGYMLPENEMLGIDIVIPDISYLLSNKDRIKGLFLSHAHEDHIGAIPYLLRNLPIDVYGSKLTIEIAKTLVEKHPIHSKVAFHIINKDTVLTLGNVKISFFATTHSIPDSLGISIHTSRGAIVYTGDFKFDQGATALYKADIGKIAQIGQEGVLALLSDSKEAEKPGYSTSEAVILQTMIDSFNVAKGRIISVCFASDFIRLQHIFDSAEKSNRKVAFLTKQIQPSIKKALELGYLTIKEDILIDISSINEYAEDEIVIIATGVQNEPIETLNKMARNQNKPTNLKKGDTVLLAFNPLRGSEVYTFKTIDLVYRAGATVINGKGVLSATSHGHQEELKMMINLLQPTYFFPVQGEYRMLKAHTKIAVECGIPAKNCFIFDKGEFVELTNNQIKLGGKVNAGHVLIDGSGVGDVGNIVLRDRRLLSQDGILLVVVTLSKKEKRVVSGPEIITRGFVYVRESEALLVEASSRVRTIVEKNIEKDIFDWTGIKQEMRDELNQFLYEKTKRRPMILPIIMEV